MPPYYPITGSQVCLQNRWLTHTTFTHKYICTCRFVQLNYAYYISDNKYVLTHSQINTLTRARAMKNCRELSIYERSRDARTARTRNARARALIKSRREI